MPIQPLTLTESTTCLAMGLALYSAQPPFFRLGSADWLAYIPDRHYIAPNPAGNDGATAPPATNTADRMDLAGVATCLARFLLPAMLPAWGDP